MASWKKILVEGDDAHLGNANLTADSSREYDINGNSLTIQANGGDFFIKNNTTTRFEVNPLGVEINGVSYPATDGTSGQALVTNGSGILSFATVGGASNTNIANTNLTSDNNRTLDLDANTLTIDINDGEFILSDSNANDQYIKGSANLLELGDSGMVVESDGVFQAKRGIEHDEGNLSAAGDFGTGAEITYLGASSTSTTAGKIYYYNGTTWASYTTATEAPQKALLGMAIGTTMAKGFLLKGFVNPNGATGFTTASPVYGATNAGATTTVPTSGYQRVMGHSISTSVIFFNPSQEYIDLT